MHERIVGLYEENAAAWDRQRGRDLHERAWLERFAALLPAGGRVLDLGCGMGEPIAAWLIGRGFRITGIDSSPSLIAMAQARFPDHAWHVDDMRKLALGERFEGLIAWHSFFHLRPQDQRPMFARFAAHAAPGAALMFTSGPEHGESIGEWRGEPLYHVSLDPAEYRRLLAGNGFVVVEFKLHDPDCGHSNLWLAQRR
ncbi:MAG TPA: class I SAM-dependent methyltransferase [Allosphingosinicella sp.]|jgi:2-polyprenyl-3-methyl-5-hydroxy-6-metoxy-1,4-benzoquinol methylase